MSSRRLLKLLPVLAAGAVLWIALSAAAQPPDVVLKAEAERVAVVEKVTPSVVAIFARGGQGGGSGVLISKDGYALTNFHVVQPVGATMKCGLPDGVFYDAVLVGLDKVGDVALIKLYPPKAGQEFPFAPLGDSDLVREGDWSLAMGNPFLLATDFTPTVTFGLVSGINRYQYPEGSKGLLEYTNCIQIDTSINPGNSGGPLFNMKGELIGINGRGSFDKRGRVNSGVGYAISINQIKNFMGHLLAGLDSDHATLGATVITQSEKTGLGRMTVSQIIESDVERRGLEIDDELVSFDARPMTSVNHFKNVVGVFPRGWRLPLEYRRGESRKEILVRLMGYQKKVIEDPTQPKDPKAQPDPKGGIKPAPPSPVSKFYEAKAGFANYYFNRQERDRLLTAFHKHGTFDKVAGRWGIDGTIRLKKLTSESKVSIEVADEKAGASVRPVVRMKVDAFPYTVEPLKENQDSAELRQPLGSGGLLAAMYLYRTFLTQGVKGFERGCDHGGYEPFYPPPTDGKMPRRLKDLRVDTEVLNTEHGGYLVKWFFAKADAQLLGFEVRQIANEDPCEIYLSDYRQVGGRALPHRIQVVYGDSHYGTINVNNYRLAAPE